MFRTFVPSRAFNIGFQKQKSDFHSDLSANLHNNYVSRADLKKKREESFAAPGVESVTIPVVVNSVRNQIVPPVEDDQQPSKPARLVSGTAMKNEILQSYQDKFGADYPKPITTNSLGTSTNHLQPPSQRDLFKSSRMKPEQDKYYGLADLTIWNVVVLVVNSFLCMKDLLALSTSSKLMNKVVPETCRLLKVDWTPLLQPRLNYQDQESVDPNRVDMATALAIRVGLDPGRIVRTLEGEYTGAWRNVEQILGEVESVVTPQDYNHINRILTQGCPSVLKFEEKSDTKITAMDRGNQKTLNQNPEIVDRVINKEDRYSHLLPLHLWVCFLGANFRHNSQGMVIEEGKNPRLVWDGSTMYTPMDIVMNNMTSTEEEAEVTFGLVKILFYWLIYNLRVSFPDEVIFLALADIKACFRFPRIHPDLAGAFGFMTNSWYCLAIAMVFGSNTSASSWEPFRRAIEGLTKKYANRPDLVQKHKHYIDMVKWEVPSPDAPPPVRAAKCKLNPGVFDSVGNRIHHPSRIWVDDTLIAAVGTFAMKMALAAVIEAIFVVMGEPNTQLRQCPLAMDKWMLLIVAERQLALGLIINSRSLTVAISTKYLADTLHLIQTTWHVGRNRFRANEAAKLVGKIGRLREGAPWIRYLVSHLYASIAFALAQNQTFLKSTSVEFQRQIKMTKCAGFKNMEPFVRFAIKKAAKLVHHCPVEYNIVESMREEIEFFARYLKPDSGVKWEAPIAHLIDRTPFASTFGDACLESGGGYSIKLKLWYFVSFPKDVVLRTLKHLKNNKDKNLISINVLEFVIVIINYCAAWTVVAAGQVTDDPHPVLLNAVDNTSAHSWTTNTCKSSRIGRLLAKFFCYLQMDYVLGINSTWISTTDNYVADDISRLKKLFSKSSQQFLFDFSSLQQKYPELKNCRFFQPSQDLLLILWDILLREKLPSLKQVRDLKQSGLGKLTS